MASRILRTTCETILGRNNVKIDLFLRTAVATPETERPLLTEIEANGLKKISDDAIEAQTLSFKRNRSLETLAILEGSDTPVRLALASPKNAPIKPIAKIQTFDGTAKGLGVKLPPILRPKETDVSRETQNPASTDPIKKGAIPTVKGFPKRDRSSLVAPVFARVVIPNMETAEHSPVSRLRVRL